MTNAPVVLFSLDSDGTYTLSTGRGLEALGLRPDELKGRSVFDVYADAPRMIEQVRRALAGEELVGVSEVGGVIFETWYEPLRGPDGETLGIIGVATDVTERTEAEEGLRRTLKELADLKFALDESAIVAITDQRGRISYVNEKFCEFSGYPESELLGQDHRLIISGHHPKEYIRGLWRTIAQGKRECGRGELRNRGEVRSIYWVDTTIVPFLDERGKPLFPVRGDPSRRYPHARRSRRPCARPRPATGRWSSRYRPSSTSTRPIEDFTTTYVSPQIEALTGYSPRQGVSVHLGLWKSLVRPDDREHVVAGLEQVTASGEPFGMEFRFVTRDGQDVWVRDEAVLVRDEDGKPLFCGRACSWT